MSDDLPTFHLPEQHFNYILKGEKTLDMGVGYRSRQTLSVGDRLRYRAWGRRECVAEVTGIWQYPTFDEALAHHDPHQLFPDVDDNDLGRYVSTLLPHPPHEQEYGVVVLEVHPVEDNDI